MKSFRWDHIKRAAQDAFLARFRRGSPFPSEGQFLALIESFCNPGGPRKPLVVMEAWDKYALNLIDNWDIRCCMKLVACFPDCLPAIYRNQKPSCDYDEKGNWILIFT